MSNPNVPYRPLPDAARATMRRIETSCRPLLVSHIRLDGDAIGSQLALAHMLKARGAEPHVVTNGPIPRVYQFLPGIQWVDTSVKALRGDYDLAVVLDTPTWDRVREIRDRLRDNLAFVSIDHHRPIQKMGDPEWVDSDSSSVGEMIYYLARAGRWHISPEAATCLYTAILTDTGRFTFPNTSPASLRVAADLIELGADQPTISEKVYQEESPQLLRLRGKAIEGLKLFADGKLALMSLTRAMMRQAGVEPVDTQEMAQIPRSLAGVVVGVLLREMTTPGMVKVSLRSRNGFNIEPVARAFGGGGHHEAAGCEIRGTLASVEEVVVERVTRILRASALVTEA